MDARMLIVGGGIGGMAMALAGARVGCQVRLYERAPAFSEVGAGIQLGPNVTRVLQAWGLQQALHDVAAFPQRLQVRHALSGAELGVLRLGSTMQERYGAPYATIHRADLHQLLHEALRGHESVALHSGHPVRGYAETTETVSLQLDDGTQVTGDLLIGADGLWSGVRQQMLADGPPRVTGHLAYRALLPQAALPEALRSQQVTVWLGPCLHVVQYPVRAGAWLNLVAIVHGQVQEDASQWDGRAHAADLMRAVGSICTPLQALLETVPQWRLWALSDRPPLVRAGQMALGRVALLGDAAHPMRPYLAQGAGMALEDAAALAHLLPQANQVAIPALLRQYALNRWQRNARVQARSLRNGTIFHAQGPLRVGRDLALRVLGERLLDMPWLYGGA